MDDVISEDIAMANEEVSVDGYPSWKEAYASQKQEITEIKSNVGKNTEAIADIRTRVSNIESKVDDMMEMMKKMMNNIQVDEELSAGEEEANDGDEDGNEENCLRKQAEDAQDKIPFDEHRIYETLLDPHGFSKKQLNDFANHAIAVYEDVSPNEVQELIDVDFKFWTANEFSLLKSQTKTTLRDFLVKRANVQLLSGRGIPVAKSLGQYMHQVRVDEAESKKKIEELKQKRNADASKIRSVPEESFRKPNSARPIMVDEASDDSTTHEGNIGLGRYRNNYRGRPSDVGKLFDKSKKYSGEPHENLRRRFQHFRNACELANINTSDDGMMLRLMSVLFVTGQAAVFFDKAVLARESTAEDAISALESQFLDKRARRVNDAVWSELTFEFLRKKREVDNQSTRYQDILADLLTQISELGEMRTGSRTDDDIMSKTLDAVRNVRAFEGICANPPEELQALHSTLRSRALQVDHDEIRNGKRITDAGIDFQEPKDSHLSAAELAAEKAYASYFYERNLRYPQDNSRRRQGYPDTKHGERRSYQDPRGFKIRERNAPGSKCKICIEKNCTSREHRHATKLIDALLKVCTDIGSNSNEDDNSDVDDDKNSRTD